MILNPDVDIAVGGRFHADRMAASLARAGFSVRLWTSLPASRFAPAAFEIRSLIGPEVWYRAARLAGWENWGDIRKSRQFGKAVASRIARSRADRAFIGWSSFSLETLRLNQHRHRFVVRDSFHIVEQIKILGEEYRRLGLTFADRNAVIERELEEYQLADTLIVLSRAARESFLRQGVSGDKILVLPLGVDTARFSAADRDDSAVGLHCIFAGTLSIRKGLPDLIEAFRLLPAESCRLTLVGPADPELQSSLHEWTQAKNIAWVGPVSQTQLASHLRSAKIFVFPTLEDGFGQTLIQAMACGCVPITTDRCGAADGIVSGTNGWILPSRDPGALAAKLGEILADPKLISGMQRRAEDTARNYSWQKYDRDFLTIFQNQTGVTQSPPLKGALSR